MTTLRGCAVALLLFVGTMAAGVVGLGWWLDAKVRRV